jgi:hypothetical protein
MKVNVGPESANNLLMALSRPKTLGFCDVVGFEVLCLAHFWGGTVAKGAGTFEAKEAREMRDLQRLVVVKKNHQNMERKEILICQDRKKVLE